MIVVKGGTVLTADGWEIADVMIDGVLVSRVGVGDSRSDGHQIDAAGMLVGPGFVDLHTHLREPGQTWKEDIESGTNAAAAGGFTAVLAMPNTEPPIDTPELVMETVSRGHESGVAEVKSAAAITRGREGYELADLEGLYRAGVRVFSDDGDAVVDESVMVDAMDTVVDLPGAKLAQHAEDPEMTIDGHLHDGTQSERHGIGGLPSEAEAAIVRRDLDLVAQTNASYHCQHVSAVETVDLVRSAKAAGLPITAEVTPHHLIFDDRELADLDPNFKMYPPLRSESDRTALRAALIDRTIDVVATDHAPHSEAEKEVPFEDAPRGVIGLETAASAVWEVVEDPTLLFQVLSSEPAGIGGFERHGKPIEPGAPANLVIFDPSATWVPKTFRSKSSNSPFMGREMKGRVITTIYDGRVTFNMERAS